MRFEKTFIKSVAAILLITTGLKVLTLVVGGRQLGVADPLLFFLSNKALIELSIVVEFTTICFLIIRVESNRQLFLILWISCVFLLYHIGLWISGYKFTCYCAGTPFSWLAVLPLDGKTIIKFLLGYMLIGSGYFIILRSRHAQMLNEA